MHANVGNSIPDWIFDIRLTTSHQPSKSNLKWSLENKMRSLSLCWNFDRQISLLCSSCSALHHCSWRCSKNMLRVRTLNSKKSLILICQIRISAILTTNTGNWLFKSLIFEIYWRLHYPLQSLVSRLWKSMRWGLYLCMRAQKARPSLQLEDMSLILTPG